MRRVVALVCVVCCVLTAGCGSFAGEQTTTRQPFDVPTTTEPPAPEIVPGLRATGVTDPAALAARHRAVVEDTSYVRQRVTTVTGRNGTVREREIRTLSIGSNGSALYTIWSSGERLAELGLLERNVSIWTNGSVTAVRTGNDGGEARYEVLDGRQRVPDDPTGAELVRTTFAAATQVNVTTQYWSGDSYYTVNASLASAYPTVFPNRSQFRLSADVVHKGVVAGLSVHTLFSRNGTDYVRDYDQSIRAVGSTEVDRPSWVAVALNTTARSRMPAETERLWSDPEKRRQ
ncbi:hypothetical protein [Haloarchaeobius sp. DFWS5]|uniref:hypothetical protein n=1 Tax=Haloarchaeobius sp. DFWS5 TaxID=3446114 RepID=UPI003EB73975